MVHDDEECAREDFGIAMDVMNAAIRQIVSESAHCSYPLPEMVFALLCAAHRITGARLSPGELAAIGRRADTTIAAVEEVAEFEAEAQAGLDELPVADVAPRVLISKADTDAIAARVVELLRHQAVSVTEAANG